MVEEAKNLRFVAFDEDTDLSLSRLGTREPTGGHPVQAIDLDAIVVPGVAFDRRGSRVGFGQGWYDRTLADIASPPEGPLLIGLCYDEQVVSHLPQHRWDRSVQVVVTPSATTTCNE